MDGVGVETSLFRQLKIISKHEMHVVDEVVTLQNSKECYCPG